MLLLPALRLLVTASALARPPPLFNKLLRCRSYYRHHNTPEERMLDRTNTWRRQEGLCLICGQPVAAPLYRQGASGRVALPRQQPQQRQEEDDEEEAFVAAIDSDGRLLTQECPVRMSLLSYNALGEFHASHILDDYTLIEVSRSKTSFRAEFAKHEALLRAANPHAVDLFKAKVLNEASEEAKALYSKAAGLGKRVIGELTVCACKRCNLAMNRIPAHAMAVYRCFSVTRDSDVALLEDTHSATANAAKKVIQQMALFFTPCYADDGVVVNDWRVKNEEQLLLDGALWRCIAHLSDWGGSPPAGGVRARLIATFHAAHFIFLKNSSLRDTDVDFTAWYTHVWRPFYMAQFPTPNTFFGMRQAEVARVFDFAFKDGRRWEATLRAMLARHGDDLDARVAVHADTLLRNLSQHEDALAAAAVVDERGLLEFYCRVDGGLRPSTTAAKLQRWLAWFQYSLDGSFGAAFFARQLAALRAEIGRAMLSTTLRAPQRLVGAAKAGIDIDDWLSGLTSKLSLRQP